jgi:electron transfer flavoprotein alpha subunit
MTKSEDITTGPVWVIAEQAEGRVLTVSLQLVGQARVLADSLGTQVEAVLLGEGVEGQARRLYEAGADRVYIGDSNNLAFYHPESYTEMIVRLVEEHKPEILLLGSTHMGRELAPLLAGILRTGLTAHCTDLLIDKDKVLEARIPAYGGLMSILCPDKRPQMATVARGVFPTPEPEEGREGELVRITVPENLPGRIKTLEIVREGAQGVPLESASVVVAGGAGAGDLEGWGIISEFAGVLNAALGCTRPAVDEGWAELDSMIGQSGIMVSPDFYIGVGLSGEQQHMVGITDAQVMVAINNDPKASVFEQVDYGIVEDCLEFLPVLLEKINAYKLGREGG